MSIIGEYEVNKVTRKLFENCFIPPGYDSA